MFMFARTVPVLTYYRAGVITVRESSSARLFPSDGDQCGSYERCRNRSIQLGTAPHPPGGPLAAVGIRGSDAGRRVIFQRRARSAQNRNERADLTFLAHGLPAKVVLGGGPFTPPRHETWPPLIVFRRLGCRNIRGSRTFYNGQS
jgi:hypothetical protein